MLSGDIMTVERVHISQFPNMSMSVVTWSPAGDQNVTVRLS